MLGAPMRAAKIEQPQLRDWSLHAPDLQGVPPPRCLPITKAHLQAPRRCNAFARALMKCK